MLWRWGKDRFNGGTDVADRREHFAEEKLHNRSVVVVAAAPCKQQCGVHLLRSANALEGFYAFDAHEFAVDGKEGFVFKKVLLEDCKQLFFREKCAHEGEDERAFGAGGAE